MGFWVAPAVVFMLPKRDRMDEVAYNRGQIVSEFRRIIAWALDMLVIMAPVAVFFAFQFDTLGRSTRNNKFVVASERPVRVVRHTSLRLPEIMHQIIIGIE